MVFSLFKRMISKKELNLKAFLKGVLICENCKQPQPLEKFPPLTFSKCLDCSEYNFIPVRIKDYCLFRQLGGGGMGKVYKALNLNTGKIVSVKILHRDMYQDEASWKKAIHEYEIGKTFSGHPSIVRSLDLFEENKTFYLVSEFIDGVRLDNLVDKNNMPQVQLVLRWIKEMTSALQYIYDSGYLYRDLKPQNIIIENVTGKVKIVDFGLVISLDYQPSEENHTVEGSPEYNITPERSNFGKEGIYSEIYGLGMVMYFCLAGKPFYSSDSAHDLVNLHRSRLRVRDISSKLPNLDPYLCSILDKMIKINPEERYQTYKEFLDDLNKVK